MPSTPSGSERSTTSSIFVLLQSRAATGMRDAIGIRATAGRGQRLKRASWQQGAAVLEMDTLELLVATIVPLRQGLAQRSAPSAEIACVRDSLLTNQLTFTYPAV